VKSLIITILFLTLGKMSQAQRAAPDSSITVMGEIRDRSTNSPLAYATISIAWRVEQTYSLSTGGFILSLPVKCIKDTLVVSYMGYATYKRCISELMPSAHVLLEQVVTVLPEVIITSRKIDLRFVDRNARLIRGNLYAMNCEVTNIEYNYFLSDLQERRQAQLFEVCNFDLTGYPKAAADFYSVYHHSPQSSRRHRQDSLTGYGDFPAVNISHTAAMEYCNWLTEKYNENPGKKKFKKVKFRLPTLKEWQIAALGYYKFQSWNLLENKVESIVPPDSNLTEILKGKLTVISVTDRVLYPWYKAYYYRDKPQNFQQCFMGNFRVDYAMRCPAQNPGYDGFIIQGRVGSYFPNNMGLYDVVGNVAEMIYESGKALGGSWKDDPKESTIRSIKDYFGPDESVGFRVFMEIIEK
jgi:hypothetical protein